MPKAVDPAGHIVGWQQSPGTLQNHSALWTMATIWITTTIHITPNNHAMNAINASFGPDDDDCDDLPPLE